MDIINTVRKLIRDKCTPWNNKIMELRASNETLRVSNDALRTSNHDLTNKVIETERRIDCLEDDLNFRRARHFFGSKHKSRNMRWTDIPITFLSKEVEFFMKGGNKTVHPPDPTVNDQPKYKTFLKILQSFLDNRKNVRQLYPGNCWQDLIVSCVWKMGILFSVKFSFWFFTYLYCFTHKVRLQISSILVYCCTYD